MDNKENDNQNKIDRDEDFDPVIPRRATGNAPVLVEIICERVHCVMYDYAINTVDMVAETFGDQIDIQTIVRRGDLKNAMRFLKMCKKAGKLLSVPTIIVNGEVAFTTVPHPDELTSAIEKHLALMRDAHDRKDPLK
jgi:hypothetical protein